MTTDGLLCSLGHGTVDPRDPTAAQIAVCVYYLFDTYGISPQIIKDTGPV